MDRVMDTQHVASLKAIAGSRVPVAVGVHRGEVVVATPGALSENDVCVRWLCSVRERQLTLNGHREAVGALMFSTRPSSPTLLCSASADSVLLWNLDQEDSEGGTPQGHLLPCSLRGPVNHVCFSPDAQHLAVCAAQETLVFHTESCTLDTTLVGHSAPVTSAIFSPHHAHTTVVTVSEDRTFKVWDLAQSSLVYQSPIVSASPFLSASIASHQELLATGTADGKLRVYSISQTGGYRCLHECDAGKELERMAAGKGEEMSSGPSVIHSTTPRRHQSCESHVTQDTPTSVVETGPAILGLFYWLADDSSSSGQDREGESVLPSTSVSIAHNAKSHVSEVLKQPPSLLAATHLGLLRFNAHTLELLEYLDFRDPTAAEGTRERVPAAATCAFVRNPVDERVYCAFGAMFHSTVTVLSLRRQKLQDKGGEDDQPCCQTISVLSSAPLVANSPLRAEFTPRSKLTTATSGGKKKKVAEKGRHQRIVMEQPLTFKSKVKSSGYAEAPRTKMFVPKTGTSGEKLPAIAASKKSSETLRKQEYPLSCGPTTKMWHSSQLSDRAAAINSACYSGNGHYLACACADKAAYIVKTPSSSGKTQAYAGHDGTVYSACWSHDSQWLLTCSSDRSARVWGLGHKDPLLLSITTTLHNFPSGEGSNSTVGKSTCNSPFAKEVTSAHFYYMDKFLLLTSGNTLHFYKYYIDTSQLDDIKRYQSNTRYKVARSLEVQSAQTITASSCVNDFHSYIVLVGCSNKTLEVYDMNTSQSVRTVTDIHTRPIHCIAQNKGSRYVTHGPDAYDLFLTSAVTDGIKLWDLRTNRCVCRFTSHRNQSHSVSATFSPCARFIATGSEDRSTYIYDIRSSSPLHKLPGHSDVVTSVAYHPLKPLILDVSELNGFMDQGEWIQTYYYNFRWKDYIFLRQVSDLIS